MLSQMIDMNDSLDIPAVIVTVYVQLVVLPPLSVAVAVTCEVPTFMFAELWVCWLNIVDPVELYTTDTPPQLSEA
jgi:hypothetical protein